jgi:preflagellin peptidase FlaK
MQAFFTAANVTLCLGFLLYASWSDYKTREVDNRVWIIYAPIALALSLVNILLFDPSRLTFFGLSFGVTSSIAILLFYTGGFGGADSKALMCIALALPFSTETLFYPLLPGGASPLSQILFPLTVFSNGVLFAAATGVYMIFYNILWHRRTGKKPFEGTLSNESAGKKLVAMITGHRVSVAKLREKWHIYPMEDIKDESEANQPRRKLVVVPKDEGRDEIVARLSKAAFSGRIDSYVWATPGLPMLIFMTVGFVVALVFGDVVWLLVSFIFR